MPADPVRASRAAVARLRIRCWWWLAEVCELRIVPLASWLASVCYGRGDRIYRHLHPEEFWRS